VFEFNFRHVGKVKERANDALAVQIKQYADNSANEQEGKLVAAKQMLLGVNKEEVIAAVLGFVRTKKVAGITQDTLESAYDAAENHRDWYGSPNTVYGVVNGLTEISQRTTHTDDRMALDKAAGRVLEMAF
jgi:hypothetical protein